MADTHGKAEKIEVNGIYIEVETVDQKLSAYQILELAKEKGAIPGDPKDYILQGDKGKYKGDDDVDLREDRRFITVRDRATPVAGSFLKCMGTLKK